LTITVLIAPKQLQQLRVSYLEDLFNNSPKVHELIMRLRNNPAVIHLSSNVYFYPILSC